MNEFNQSWSERAQRRGAGASFFRPPERLKNEMLWHVVDTHLGRLRLQWRPGIDCWHGEEGERWTAEFGAELAWTYVGLSDRQTAAGYKRRTLDPRGAR